MCVQDHPVRLFFPFPSFFLNWENTACRSYGFSKAVGSSLTGAPSSQLGYSEHKGRREEPIGQSAFPVLKPGRWVWCCASPGKGIHPHTSHKPGPSWVSGSLISDTMNTICPCFPASATPAAGEPPLSSGLLRLPHSSVHTVELKTNLCLPQ